MPNPKPAPIALPSDELLMAAIDRAQRHRTDSQRGVMLETVKAHLQIPPGSWSTRRLRPQLDQLRPAA